MGIFNSIADAIVDLGDWAGNAGTDVFNFASNNLGDLSAKDVFGGAKALFSSQDARKKQAFQNVNSNFLDQGKVKEKDNSVTPTKGKYGLENFAGGPADPAAIEEYWHGVLQKFVQTSQTGVNKAR